MFVSLTFKTIYISLQEIRIRNIEGIFRKYSIEILQYCKNIYKAVRKVSKLLQEPCNVCSKRYKWNIAAILIFHFNIAVM